MLHFDIAPLQHCPQKLRRNLYGRLSYMLSILTLWDYISGLLRAEWNESDHSLEKFQIPSSLLRNHLLTRTTRLKHPRMKQRQDTDRSPLHQHHQYKQIVRSTIDLKSPPWVPFRDHQAATPPSIKNKPSSPSLFPSMISTMGFAPSATGLARSPPSPAAKDSTP